MTPSQFYRLCLRSEFFDLIHINLLYRRSKILLQRLLGARIEASQKASTQTTSIITLNAWMVTS